MLSSLFQRLLFLIFGPDPSENLPQEINWLELAKVRELNINGEVLHKLPFLRDQTLHKYMELAEMEVIYDSSLPSIEGYCQIRFGFNNYFRKRIGNIEFVVDFVKINPKDEHSSVPLSSIKNQLYKEFWKFKTEKYEWCKLQNINKQYTPTA
jgi:hypothetical protein